MVRSKDSAFWLRTRTVTSLSSVSGDPIALGSGCASREPIWPETTQAAMPARITTAIRTERFMGKTLPRRALPADRIPDEYDASGAQSKP